MLGVYYQLPSFECWKCLMAAATNSNSLSKVLYLVSASLSLWEKNARGWRSLRVWWCNTSLLVQSLSLVVIESTAFLTGWTRRVALAGLFLTIVAALLILSVTSNSRLVVVRESLRGWTMWARQGRRNGSRSLPSQVVFAHPAWCWAAGTS